MILIMRMLYNIYYYPTMLMWLFSLIWRSRKEREYLKDISERFGYINKNKIKDRLVLITPNSIGEMITAAPFIKKFKSAYPECNILIAMSTLAGLRIASSQIDERTSVAYLPFDTMGAMSRFIQTVKPLLWIILEADYPINLIYCCDKFKIPFIAVNASIFNSQVSFFRLFSPPVLDKFKLILTQSEKLTRRFIKAGVDSQKVKTIGNLKFVAEIEKEVAKKNDIKAKWGKDRLVLMAGSTHKGEEESLLEMLSDLRKSFPDLLLVIAPRHHRRFQEVEALCKEKGYETASRTANLEDMQGVDIFILNTLGELASFYSFADVVFLGGSLVPIGGHNPIEPAAHGVPTIVGPYTHNFDEINNELIQKKALFTVKNLDELEKKLFELLKSKELRKKTGDAAKNVVERNREILDRYIEEIESYTSKNLIFKTK